MRNFHSLLVCPLLLTALGMGTVSVFAQSAVAVAAPATVTTSLNKLTFEEKHSTQTLTIYSDGGSSSTTESVSRSDRKTKLSAELSLKEGASLTLQPDTEIVVTVGRVAFTTRLKDDTGFKPGDTKASIPLLVPSESGSTRQKYGTLILEQTKDRLKLKLEAKDIPGSENSILNDFAKGPDSFEGTTDVTVQVGSLMANTSLNFKGKRKSGDLSRSEAASLARSDFFKLREINGASGQSVTLEVKGEYKRP